MKKCEGCQIGENCFQDFGELEGEGYCEEMRRIYNTALDCVIERLRKDEEFIFAYTGAIAEIEKMKLKDYV